MAQSKRLLPQARNVAWRELRHRATVSFMWLQQGWTALSDAERDEVRLLVGKSGGRPRNLTKAETQRLGALAAKLANAAARGPRDTT